MSGFSPEWLALREPVDHAARNRDVLAACATAFAGRDRIAVCDMGAGTGSSLRALADHLPAIQHWTLVDHDQGNLAAAMAALSKWADTANVQGDTLSLTRDNKRIAVQFHVRDFASDPECWPAGVDLVTASALFDLTSEAWLTRLAAALGRVRLSLLAALTFDGVIHAQPAEKVDASIATAFRAHQHRNKGFGPAAGPDAPDVLERALTLGGYHVVTGDSPWKVGPEATDFLTEIAKGIAQAVLETGAVPRADIDRWRANVTDGKHTLVIGHRDLFATPSREAASA